MMTLVTILHVLTCFILVVIVLLQTGKGADMGAVFGGGSSSTIFGSSGAGNLLTKVTTGAAVVFMGTSLILAYSASHRSPATMLDRTPVQAAPQEEPAATAPQAQETAEAAGEVTTGATAEAPRAVAAEAAPGQAGEAAGPAAPSAGAADQAQTP